MCVFSRLFRRPGRAGLLAGKLSVYWHPFVLASLDMARTDTYLLALLWRKRPQVGLEVQRCLPPRGRHLRRRRLLLLLWRAERSAVLSMHLLLLLLLRAEARRGCPRRLLHLLGLLHELCRRRRRLRHVVLLWRLHPQLRLLRLLLRQVTCGLASCRAHIALRRRRSPVCRQGGQGPANARWRADEQLRVAVASQAGRRSCSKQEALFGSAELR